MSTHIVKSCLLPALLTIALGSPFTGGVSAQVFNTLYNFSLAPDNNNSDGRNPSAGLIMEGTNLFGTASSGGYYGVGTVFGLSTSGSEFISLFPFSMAADATNRDGAFPEAPLIFSGSALYGTASDYGTNGMGTVFELSLATGFEVLHTFTKTSEFYFEHGTNLDGASPVAGLVLSGTSLYGTAEYGGTNGNGGIFRVDDASLAFANLHSFTALEANQAMVYTNMDGANPESSLVLSGTILYGTTANGGVFGNGTLFSMNSDGSQFKTLHSFGPLVMDYNNNNGLNFLGTNNDGANPVAGLVISNNVLYGTAMNGGTNGNGTVFSINTSGLGFTVLHTFATGATDPYITSIHNYTNSDGAQPQGNLLLAGSLLYGTATFGGLNGDGTVFAMGISGAGFETLYTFTATVVNTNISVSTNFDGVQPTGGLILSSNEIYGTTSYGGTSGDGTVFSLSALPQLFIICSGTNVILTWPANLSGFTMQFTTNLGSTAYWVTDTVTPVVLNGQYALTNANSGKQRFFRLSQ